MDTFFDNVRCRKSQVILLSQLFGKASEVSFSSIFIYGHSSTGKTFTVLNMLKALKVKHAMVNCSECYTSKLLFEILLKRTSKGAKDETVSKFENCDNVNDFVRYFKQALVSRKKNENTFYIVLDNADELRKLDDHILPVFLRLQELVRMNVTVILISQIVWEKFQLVIGFDEPFKLHFPRFTKDEICEILQLDRPHEYSKEFYANYLNIIMNVFYIVCCNLTELRYLAKQNFPKYVEPVLNKTSLESNTQKLWRNIEPQLKKALQCVYLRYSIKNSDESDAVGLLPRRTRANLSFYSKYLLIAAYMASYNPCRTDRRFFLKRHEKVGKRAKINSMKRNEKATCHMLGPKPFLLDRLLAIFYSIVDEKVSPSAFVYSQVSTLVTHNFLSLVGKEGIDSPKYKCNVSLEFIRSVARTVEFDIIRYLYDFI